EENSIECESPMTTERDRLSALLTRGTGQQNHNRTTNLPRRSDRRMDREYAEPELIAGGEGTQCQQLAQQNVDRDGPPIVLDLPMRSRFRLHGQRERARGLVREKRLKEHLIHIASARIPRERPDLIPERADCPRTFLLQRDDRRSRAPLAGAER